jgi:PKD domain
MPARADWFDRHWQFRRALDVNWDAANADGHELATAEFYTAGHMADGGADLRVTGQDGKLLPSHVLMVGPGDFARMVFALEPGQTKYFVYFGNPNPPPPPEGMGDVQYLCGLLFQMRTWPGGQDFNSAEDCYQAWDSASDMVGQTMIDQPFYGLEPFGPHSRCVCKTSGSLVVPIDGDYEFAGAAVDRGGLFIDGRPVLFIPNAPGDIRHNTLVNLSRGRHNFALYTVYFGDHGAFSIGWRRPDMDKVEVMPRPPFGILDHARAGQLEELNHPLVADFDAENEAECLVAGKYSIRYQFTAHMSDSSNAHFDWDFGDGVSASGRDVEHVFVRPGVYPVRVHTRIFSNQDTQITRLGVDRDWPHADKPTEDTASFQARIVSDYDAATVRPDWLPYMVEILDRADRWDHAVHAAKRLTAISTHDEPDITQQVLQKLSDRLKISGRTTDAIAFWDRAPADSDIRSFAAAQEGDLLLWWQPDFPRALQITQAASDSGDYAARLRFAMALTFAGKIDEANKVLNDLQDQQERPGPRLSAIGGAMARSIEYRIEQRDWQTGLEEWDTWLTRCPSVFTQGYAVLLRARLMEECHASAQAAKVAEAFSLGVPESAYAPALLDYASRLLQPSDPGKAQELRDLLKSRYPEDPLSQNP